jgi:5-methyltetrahydropteroyltriglutamate--homocysteine methyltransferase
MIATVVGSYPKIPNRPKPARLRNALNKRDRGDITQEELEQVVREVSVEVIQEQIEAGLDLITDGHVRWEDEQAYIAGKLGGISLNGLQRWYDNNMYFRQPVIEGDISWREAIIASDYTFAVENSSKPVKAVLTGPFTLATLSQDNHYGSVEKLSLAYAEALNAEARALEDAGAKFIQFNEPAITRRKSEYKTFSKAIARAVDGLGVETALYTYFGDVQGIYDQMLDLPVDLIGLDFATNAKNDELVKKNPPKMLGLGIVDARNTRMESTDALVERIKSLSGGVSPENVHVSPSAGLEFLPREVAQQKVRRVAEAVRAAEGVLV